MGFRYRSYRRQMSKYASAEKTVGKNMEKKVKTYLILTVLFGVLAGLLFVLVMPLAMRMEDSSICALPVALLAVVAVRMNAKRNTAKILVSVIEQIEASERTEIESLSFSPLEIESKVEILRKLMDHENLRSYEIVADRVIARRSLHLTAEKLRAEEEESKKRKQAEAGKCPYCGQGVGSSVFCPYCGRRLRQE
ncbi:MAG: zinc ribbon domain-containing protein [Clostridia bacterium]|nr:zinc ribbon domain-containing protein [Clostridia bacterium]